MNLVRRWGVAPKCSVVPADGANKHSSTWKVAAADVVRAFKSRTEARSYKAAPPKKYARDGVYIVDLNSGHVVR